MSGAAGSSGSYDSGELSAGDIHSGATTTDLVRLERNLFWFTDSAAGQTAATATNWRQQSLLCCSGFSRSDDEPTYPVGGGQTFLTAQSTDRHSQTGGRQSLCAAARLGVSHPDGKASSQWTTPQKPSSAGAVSADCSRPGTGEPAYRVRDGQQDEHCLIERFPSDDQRS